MDLHLYRYGESTHLAGLCVGIARHPPRGIRRDQWTKRGFFDVWLPQLGPSRELVAAYRRGKVSFATFATRYRREMGAADARHLITFLAAIARGQRINLGCFCADPARCHRSVLRELLVRAQASNELRAAARPHPQSSLGTCASPPCAMPEISD